MEIVSQDKTGRIRHLNDLLRCKGIGGEVMVTAGIDALGDVAVAQILQAVAALTDFDEENDPHGERDFGRLTVEGRLILFKIDYFDTTLTYRSPDPADPTKTIRVMTIMLADEY